MTTLEFTYWQDGDHWIGFLNEFPDYLTQGESFDDLKEHLIDLHQEFASGEIPHVRRRAQLELA
jgi:predicted RNase H-like HicB family nuclease